MLTIGITDCGKWKNYYEWLASENVKVIKLSYKENSFPALEKCDGVILSGGEDVHPRFYGKPEWMKTKTELKLDVNEARDEFEMKVIEKTLKEKKPLLGICRGLQIVNVYFGGTLIPNLPPCSLSAFGEEGGVRHSKKENDDQTHKIEVEKNSFLYSIVQVSSGIVNSAHHQAADKIGIGLKISAAAEDGITEAIEMKNSGEHPFFLLVQWHPERMKEQESRLVKNVRENFLSAVKK